MREAGKLYCCNWPDTGTCNCLESLRNVSLVEEYSERIKKLKCQLSEVLAQREKKG